MPLPARALAVLAVLTLSVRGRGDELPRLASFHVDRGFIDDPLALSPDGKAIAFITTDGATRSELHVAPLGAGSGAEVAVPYDSITPERLYFLDDARILGVDRDTTTRVASARVYTRQGPTRDKLGPADHIALGTVGGVPAIVTVLRSPRPKGAAYAIAAFRRDTLKPLGHPLALTENAEGRIVLAGGPVKPLYFRDDFLTLVGSRGGVYDKAHDIRKPDVAVQVDLTTGKVVSEKEIGDLVAAARLTVLRQKHDGENAFLTFSEDLRRLEAVGGDDDWKEVTLPRPLRKYDTTTLAYQPAGPDRLLFSLTIDAVNPDAVAAKKADRDLLDLYRLDLRTGAVTPLVRLDGKKRPTGWLLRDQKLALLHKHRGFTRGGTDLEVLALDGAAPTTSPAAPVAAPSSPSSSGAAPAGAPQRHR